MYNKIDIKIQPNEHLTNEEKRTEKKTNTILIILN